MFQYSYLIVNDGSLREGLQRKARNEAQRSEDLQRKARPEGARPGDCISKTPM
jgi:hypothetical protein